MTKKRVRFVPENDTVCEIESHNEYTKQERFDSWFTSKEYQVITVRSLKEASQWNGYHRGLEKHTQHGVITSTNKRQCIHAVMDEQDLQWAREEDDYDRLAEVSKGLSRLSIALAIRRGEKDAQEAQKVYQRMQEHTIRIPQMSVAKSIDEDERTFDTSVCSDLSDDDDDDDLLENEDDELSLSHRQPEMIECCA